MNCMYCGSHMNLIIQQHRTNTYICPECGTEYQHSWSLPVFEPGTDNLTENGKWLLTLHSTLHLTSKEKVYKLMQSRRKQHSIV